MDLDGFDFVFDIGDFLSGEFVVFVELGVGGGCFVVGEVGYPCEFFFVDVLGNAAEAEHETEEFGLHVFDEVFGFFAGVKDVDDDVGLGADCSGFDEKKVGGNCHRSGFVGGYVSFAGGFAGGNFPFVLDVVFVGVCVGGYVVDFVTSGVAGYAGFFPVLIGGVESKGCLDCPGFVHPLGCLFLYFGKYAEAEVVLWDDVVGVEVAGAGGVSYVEFAGSVVVFVPDPVVDAACD